MVRDTWQVSSLEQQLAAALEMCHSLLAQQSAANAAHVAATVNDLARLRRQRDVFEAREFRMQVTRRSGGERGYHLLRKYGPPGV